MQAENGNKPEMIVVVPEERLQEKPPSASKQAQHEFKIRGMSQAQDEEPSSAAQQAQHVTAGSMEQGQQPTRDISASEDGANVSGDVLESLEEVAHPQHLDGQTFFDAQEGVRLCLRLLRECATEGT